MAEARRDIEWVEREFVVTRLVEQEPGYTLTLNNEEVEVLMDIFSHIGGCPQTSRRSLVDGIISALRNAGVTYLREVTDISRISRSIYFLAPPDENDDD